MALVDFDITEMGKVVTNLDTLLTDLSSTVTTFNEKKDSLDSIWSAPESVDFKNHVINESTNLEATITRYQEYITFLKECITTCGGDLDALVEAIKNIQIEEETAK